MDKQLNLIELVNQKILQLSTRLTSFNLKIESYDLPEVSSKDKDLYKRQLEEELEHNQEILRILKS